MTGQAEGLLGRVGESVDRMLDGCTDGWKHGAMTEQVKVHVYG